MPHRAAGLVILLYPLIDLNFSRAKLSFMIKLVGLK